MEIKSRIREFYNRTPYPYTPPFFKYRIGNDFFEILRKSIGKESEPESDILIIGCGVVAPRAFRKAYPKRKIFAVDISENTLKKAYKYCGSLASTIYWLNGDLESDNFPKIFAGRKYKNIHCTGVLQLPRNTEKAIKNLSLLLDDDGIVRFLIYSKGARIWIEFARLAFLLQNLKNENDIKNYLSSLDSSHPFFFILATYGESLFKEGTFDGFLVPEMNLYYLDEWENMFNKSGLSITKLDRENYIDGVEEYFPENLKEKVGKLSSIEKISMMERFGEWRSDFTGVLTKTSKEPISPLKLTGETKVPNSISLPRYYLWNEMNMALKHHFGTLSSEELKYIIDNLEPRRWLGGIRGLLTRYKWNSWNDNSRLNSSQSHFFGEKFDFLYDDHIKNLPQRITPPETWEKCVWDSQLTNW